MIDLYARPAPNGQEIRIVRDKTGLPYRVHAIDIGPGDQLQPRFLTMFQKH